MPAPIAVKVTAWSNKGVTNDARMRGRARTHADSPTNPMATTTASPTGPKNAACRPSTTSKTNPRPMRGPSAGVWMLASANRSISLRNGAYARKVRAPDSVAAATNPRVGKSSLPPRSRQTAAAATTATRWPATTKTPKGCEYAARAPATPYPKPTLRRTRRSRRMTSRRSVASRKNTIKTV